MRILELSGDTGSTYVIAQHLAKAWRAQGDEVHVIAPVRNRFDLRVMTHILQNRRHYDVIHAHLGDAVVLGNRLSGLLGIPFLATLHGFQKAKHYRGVRRLTAVSHAVKAHFVAQGITSDMIEVVHNGFPDHFIAPPDGFIRPADLQNRLVIGTAGVLSPIKQHALLLDALSLLVPHEPSVLLLIAGAGPLEDQLREKVRILGLAAHVRFIGYQKDLHGFYYSLDLYAQTSRHEGFCLPLLEAMACGLPVVTTASGGPEEFVHHERNGLIETGMNAQGVAQLLRTLLHDSALRKRIGTQAKNDVISLSWTKQAERYKAVLREMHRA